MPAGSTHVCTRKTSAEVWLELFALVELPVVIPLSESPSDKHTTSDASDLRPFGSISTNAFCARASRTIATAIAAPVHRRRRLIGGTTSPHGDAREGRRASGPHSCLGSRA